jgi:hypothetical protein
MNATLIPAATAIARFFPSKTDFRDCFVTFAGHNESPKVLLVEGDLSIDTTGLVQTERLCPQVIDGMGKADRLVGVVVTGNLIAPKATLLEPDIDWSPRIKVLGGLHVHSLCLGGSVFEVAGDLTAEGTIFGFYNHGILRVGGKIKADVILSDDYTMELSGAAICRYALGSPDRMKNIPINFASADLELVLDPELMDSHNSLKEAEIIQRLSRSGSILKPKDEIGAKSKPRMTKAACEKLAAIAKRADAGEAILEIDLTDSDLKYVPEDIRGYRELRVLRLSKNNVMALPAWIAEFQALEVLAVERCGLTTLPKALGLHPRLRELDISYNEIDELPLMNGAFPALEKLRIGEGRRNVHVQFLANLDLAAFPKLRVLYQDFSNLPELAFAANARLWNAPALEYFDCGAVFDEAVPKGLLDARALRGLECAVAANAFESALAILPQLSQLEVLTMGYGSELGSRDVASLHAALPGVYIRVLSDDPFESDTDERKALCRQITNHIHQQQFFDAVAAADRLFAVVDLDRPNLPAALLETAMLDRLRASTAAAQKEANPAARRSKLAEAAGWADRVLARLPHTPDVCWWANRRSLGLLRFDCLMAKTDELIEQGSKDGHDQARELLDIALSEIERHLADNVLWLAERRERIAARRVMLSN